MISYVKNDFFINHRHFSLIIDKITFSNHQTNSISVHHQQAWVEPGPVGGAAAGPCRPRRQQQVIKLRWKPSNS